MSNKNKIIFILIVFFQLTGNLFANNKQLMVDRLKDMEKNCENIDISKTVGLDDLVNLCVCNNPELKAEYLNVEMAISEKKQANAEYMPTISASASTSKNRSKIEDGDNTNSKPYSAKLSLQWLIYDFGGREARNRTYKNNVDINNFSYNSKLYDVLLSVNVAYLNLLGAEEILKSAEENEKAFKKSYEESSKKYKIGMSTLNEKLQAKTQYEESILEVIDARNKIKQYSGDLATLLNLSPTTVFKLRKPRADRDITELDMEDNVDKMIEIALKSRSEVKKQMASVEYSKNNLKNMKSNFLPTISLEGSLSYNNKWDSNSKYQNDSYIGVQLSVPIFTGFSNVNKTAEAKYNYRQARYLLEVTKNTVANEVWSAYQDYKQAIESYKISQQVLESAIENLKVASKSYSVGRIDIINLLTANSTLANARKDRINNFYKVLISKSTLYRKIGEI